MNRAQRRKMMKKNPKYREALKTTAKKSVEDLEKIFQKRWQEIEELKENNDSGIGLYGCNIEDSKSRS